VFQLIIPRNQFIGGGERCAASSLIYVLRTN
jgi:hypothetical protein